MISSEDHPVAELTSVSNEAEAPPIGAAGEQLQWAFVHGAVGNGDFWELVRADFPGAWIVDLPGHAAGRARRSGAAPPAPPDPPFARVEDYADWLMAQIAAAGGTNVVLVGHSLGGAIVQTVAARQPPWLRGLVLSGTGARLRVAPALGALLRADYPAAVDWLIDHFFAGTLSPYRRAGIRRQMLRIPQAVALGDFAACDAFDLRAVLEQEAIAAPAVVLCGDADQMTPPRYSEYLAAHISGAVRRIVPDAGHQAPVEQPAAWSALVRQGWAQATGSRPAAAT